MSKVSTLAKEKSKYTKEREKLRLNETVKNFMGGDSYNVNPLLKLKMITASSIFGEPQYYRAGIRESEYSLHDRDFSGLLFSDDKNKTASQIMEETIDAALDYNFEQTVNWALVLRYTYNMRLNPQIIMVRAAIHPKRKEFNLMVYDDPKKQNWFREMNKKVMKRADEPAVQMAYYIYLNNGKVSNCPNILKRSWKDKLESLNAYQINKYKNAELGMINVARICHANKGNISELMSTGIVKVPYEDKTWENLKAAGYTWKQINQVIDMPAMATLRNLRGMFIEINDREFAQKTMQKIKDNVIKGQQFPFRYYSAMKALEGEHKYVVNHKAILLDGLEECMDIALENMPKLAGRTMCLTDNSGSAWGTITSEYGTVTVAEINNLSSVLTAMNSDEGYVGKFGDKLKIYEIRKRKGTLQQAEEITSYRYSDVGGQTEGGIWLFFKNAIVNKEWWDNIFIYSDQQAGTGNLYGTSEHSYEYKKLGYNYGYSRNMINVYKLIEDYRKKVNPKVNVYSIQTAGYDNVVIPEYAYRTNILYGWTGKELVFADAMNKLWDEFDNENKQKVF